MEIIVVLFIIAIAASLLLYGARNAYRTVRKNTCLNEMGLISAAIQAYSTNIDDVYFGDELSFGDLIVTDYLKKTDAYDVWGQEYKVKFQDDDLEYITKENVLKLNKTAAIYSSGPDKAFETKDDIEHVFIINTDK